MSWPLSQDYNESIQDPRNSFSDAELKTGEAVANALGIPMPRSATSPCLRSTLSVRLALGRQMLHASGVRPERALQRDQQKSRLAKLPFAVDFTYLEQGIRVRGQWYPILKMQWAKGFVLNEFVRDNLDKNRSCRRSGKSARMARRLRESYIAHCDLQHGNVLLVPGSTPTRWPSS